MAVSSRTIADLIWLSLAPKLYVCGNAF